MTARHLVLDRSVRRHGNVLVGGSPLKLFRLTGAGASMLDRIEAGGPVEDSELVRRLLDAGAVHPAGRSSSVRHTAADVTVVVPTRGSAVRAPAGAIVVDDGAEPPVPDATVRLPANRGPAAARNAGLAAVSTRLVAFVDDDVELPEGWLADLLPHFDDEAVVAVAPRVASTPGSSLLARWEAANGPLDLGADPARVRSGTRVSYVPAAALVCRAAAVRDVGGFDESLRFGEDVDLIWRLDEAGGTVRYEPATVVQHEPRPDWAAWWRQRVGYGSSAAPLARRHPGALAPIRMSGWTFAAWAAAMAASPLTGLGLALGTSAALVRKLDGVPARDAFLLAWRGNVRGGDQLAAAVRRAWWPLFALAAVRSRAARRVLVASAVAARHPLRLADDTAYSVGVWRGMGRERTIAPLVPELRSWPGRRARSARRDASDGGRERSPG